MLDVDGTASASSKLLALSAEAFRGAGTVGISFLIVYRFPDEDHFVVELTARGEDGSKGPTMETTYTRKK